MIKIFYLLLINFVSGLEDDLKFEISWFGSNKDVFQVKIR
jgi:hypothetical protein